MVSKSNQYRGRFREYLHNFLFFLPGYLKLSIRLLLVGLCIGVAIRVGILWFVDYRIDVGDSRYYLSAAHNLLEYHIYSGDINNNPVPEMYRPPVYSFFIAFVTWIFGNSLLCIQLVQLIVSIITALLITRVAAFFQPKAAPWVFGLMMFSPFEAVYTGAVLSETITTFLLVAAAYVILTIEGLKRWVMGGILLGFCVLARDIYIPLIMLIAGFWIVLGSGRKRFRCFEVAVLILSVCLVVLPWTVRNYHVSERLVPVSDGRLGLSLWMGTWATNGAFTENDAAGQRVYPPQAFRDKAEKDLVENALGKGVKEGDRTLRSVAIQRIYDDPVAVLSVYFARAPLLWLGTRFDIFQLNTAYFPRNSHSYTAVKSILWGLNFVLILFGIAGMVLAWYQRNKILILALPVLYTALIYFPLNGFENRYSQPVYPFLLVFAGVAAVSFTNKLNLIRRRTSHGH